MKTNLLPRLSTLPLIALCLALACSLSSVGHAADTTCPAVFDALTKVVTTPHHSFMTETAAYRGSGKSLSSESILVGGANYIKVDGKWIRSSYTPEAMLKQSNENRKNARNVSCHYVRDELAGGEAAAVYSAHSESEDAKSDVQVWISKSSGLPLREEIDMDIGGTMGKSHRTMRYEYGNVKPPM